MSIGKKSAARRKPLSSGHCIRHPLFCVWKMMRVRCNNPRHIYYKNYGGRGIRVCPEWNSFWTFVFDIGSRPEGTSLDRIDNDGPYAPWNCKWSTRKEQAANSRYARFEHDGERLTFSALAARLGVHVNTLRRRVARHGIDRAISMGVPK